MEQALSGQSDWERLRRELEALLGGMRSSLCVVDPDSYRILFMNETMKDDFGLQCPEGAYCWQVLQQGLQSRCALCPIDELREMDADAPAMQWDEDSVVAGRMYRNFSSLVPWVDGSRIYVRQSVEITEVSPDATDELTGLLARRAGKDRLTRVLRAARAEERVLSVCLYDMNYLKNINDMCGHIEGDRFIQSVSRAVCERFESGDFGFRLSGDEFVCVLQGDAGNAREMLDRVRDTLVCSEEFKLCRDQPFSYGIVEVQPGDSLELDEILALADERMYDQKRRFHIEVNNRRLGPAIEHAQASTAMDVSSFAYDKDRLYDAIVESTDDYLYVCNMKTGIFRYPRTMVEEFGLPGEIVENAAAVWGAHVHEDDRQAFLDSNQEIVDGRTTQHCVEYRACNSRGEWVWLRCRGHLILDGEGKPDLFAGIITNLGKKNKIDHLTGLFNKYEFEDFMQHAIETRPNEPLGLMIVGIDDFRHINDLHNRAFGDDVLRIVGQRIQSVLPGRMTVFRLDGDEFAIVGRDAAAMLLRHVYDSLSDSFLYQQEHDGRKYYCTLSAGTALYPQDTSSSEDLVKFANYALEHSKTHGKKRSTRFSKNILLGRMRELELVELLRNSVEQDFDGFSLCYQPQVEALNGRVMGAEALCRWTCQKYGSISPMEFIPLLEQSGLIVPVGAWVLRESAKTCKRWQAHNKDFVMSVNLSYRQLEETELIPLIEEILVEEELPPRNLVVEMTESYFSKSDRTAQGRFSAIRGMGVRIAMDDFGTGYSTLGILKKSPADIVKIDRTFIHDILTSTFDATFIRFVVELCHDVGISVCLEGVETGAEYEAVRDMGLDFIQGFFFGRPYPVEEFEQRFFSTE